MNHGSSAKPCGESRSGAGYTANRIPMAFKHDLVIRGGSVIDGTGRPPLTADVAIDGGIITAVGRIEGTGRTEIDADGLYVTPGFVDIHTHYDGHATWTQRLEPSCQHGVTTVVMGNCGVGFAPCKPEHRDGLVQLMEGVEDIPEAVMSVGLPWSWQTFPEYLDRLAERHFDVDVAAQLPHAPLRVFVMGERALTREPATPDDIAKMRALAKQAVQAGALGFSTSRTLNHKASDGTLTPSYVAAADELAGIARGLSDAGRGVLQFISDFDDVEAEFAIARRMVQESGRPMSISLLQYMHVPDRWRSILERIEAASEEGLPIQGQVCGRPIGIMLGFCLGRNPFMETPAYREVAHLPDRARLEALREPARRERILREFLARPPSNPLFGHFAGMYELDTPVNYEPRPQDSLAARAARVQQPPAAYAYDVLTAGPDVVIYCPAANFADNSIAAIETMLASEHTILGLGDGGAHCGLICDASLPTYMLLRWSTAGGGPMPVEKVVQSLSAKTAQAVGLYDRGVVAAGRRADLNIIDFDKLSLDRPRVYRDLPMGGERLGQPASGYEATLVAGQVTYRNGTATGALPGRLVRGASAASARLP